MGRTSDEEGETSAKNCRSDDSSERPLKKARYVWQIKGKYHLKKPENEDEAKLYIADETRDGYTLHPIEMPHCETEGQVHDSANSDASKPDSASSVASEVHSPTVSEDLVSWQIKKWRARQVARCFVDNTINTVLEDMGFVPLPVDADDLMEDFTMSGLRRNDHLEDAAVMMAIHSHGLQRTVRGGNQNLDSVAIVDSCVCNFSLDSVGLQNKKRRYMPDTSSPQLPVDAKHKGSSVAVDWSRPNVGPRCTCSGEFHDSQREDSTEKSVTSQDMTLDSKPLDMILIGNAGGTRLEDEEAEKKSASFEHTDFLDKAVAVAIQKKGLSTLSSIEYG